MPIHSWAKDSVKRTQENGIEGLRDSFIPIYNKIISQGNILKPQGSNIFEYDWDLLIILDACRLDLMREVANEYDFVSEVTSVRSLDSATERWMKKTFVETYSNEIQQTEYICGNPFSAKVLSDEDFRRIEEVWRKNWIDIGTVPPRAVTDSVIRANRTRDPPRILAHYMQPHCPFIEHPSLMASKELDRWGNQKSADVWTRLRKGELSRETVWNGYRDNLKYALDEVGLLLQNVSSDRVVITSDHGNAIGEWITYGHPPGSPLDSLRQVPWIRTSGHDSGEYKPDLEPESTVSVDQDDQLEALGYI